ncbi:MAG: peptidoglycan DD-metalloendopeptidase family protein [Colwellia sp.]|nr:peptidoglycan DD-metalloendopeptidase family protein [Colwellia sp.]
MIKVRTTDIHGAGHYGAPRGGGRKHSGIDFVIHKNEAITAFEDGTVSKIGFPYNPNDAKKGHLRYIEITVASGDRQRYFYADAFVVVGDDVERGDIIGYAQGLNDIYPGITEHYHFEVMKPGKGKRFHDPADVLKELGYEF